MRGLWLVPIVAACSFSSNVPNHGGDGGAIDAALPTDGHDAAIDARPIDTPPGITCAELACDVHATCNPSSPSCVCNPGYAGNGMTCGDVDECQTSNGNCPAGCANTTGGFTCYVPPTCAAIAQAEPGTTDGPQTLYVAADVAKPYTVYCADMASNPVEYLSLTGANYAQYTAGGASMGTSVRTTYTKVRFAPASLQLLIGDRRFATSTGALAHSNTGISVTSMPLTVAMDCKQNNSNTGLATVDLTATAFAISGTFAEFGNMPDHTVSLTSNNQVLSTTGGGNCGWYAPTGTPINPFNDNAAATTLQLTYAP